MGSEDKPAAAPPANRWLYLLAGVVGMAAVANFQYSWTLFVLPLETARGWSEVEVLNALFIFFIAAQTWLVPIEGYLADRFGPRRLVLAGGLFTGLAWVANSVVTTLPMLYASQVLCGCGSGIVYSTCMGTALKWFPDRRGLAAGLMAAAFGSGSVLTILPIEHTIKSDPVHGYQMAFLWFGVGQGLVVMLAGLALRFPRPGEVPPPAHPHVLQSARDYSPREMLGTPTFWLLYVMMVVGAVPGLLMMGEIKPMAIAFHIASVPVTLLGVTLAAVNFAMMIDRLAGGLTRPVFGWISDVIGRESAIFLAFALEGSSLLFLIRHNDDPVIFVITSGLAFFGWGAIFSLFPAVNTDLFGRRYATANYGWLYTAKGVSALVASLCVWMKERMGGWVEVFAVMIACDWIAALLAMFALRPLHRKWMERTAAKGEDEGARELEASAKR